MTSSLPCLAIALGDPAGIGAEVVLKALADDSIATQGNFTLVGNRDHLRQTFARLSAYGLADPDRFSLIDLPCESIEWGIGSAAGGEASFRFLEAAIDRTLAGEFQGVVTAPIAKSAWKAAGHLYPGQTEMLAEKAGVTQFGMMFVARSPFTDWTLRALLATTHIPLRQVADALMPELLTLKLELLIATLEQDFSIRSPRIAIAGLNPHSGEQGQLGREEQDWMFGWLGEMRDRFPAAQLDGLIPPDTLWVRPGQAWFGAAAVQAHDAYLALYHDQGLIPVKLMAFDRAVNTSIGLPFVRTSPDHGTAFDIAGQGKADASSMKAAIALAVELAQHRQQALDLTLTRSRC